MEAGLSLLSSRLKARCSKKFTELHIRGPLVGAEFQLDETDKEGRARVNLVLHESKECILFYSGNGGETRFFQFTSKPKCADGALLVLVAADPMICDVYVVEIKKSVSIGGWPDLREQIRGMIFRVQALCGVLTLQVRHTVCCVSYAQDLFPREDAIAKVDRHSRLGSPAADPNDAAIAWKLDELNLGGLGSFAFRKCHLAAERDELGEIFLGQLEIFLAE